METPAVYFGKQGKGIWKSKEEFSNPYNWSGYVVGQILSKPEYMGHTVNFRSHKQSYKDKTPVMNPPEEWLIFENTHEAIVDAETWELAQKLRKTPRRHDTLGEANPLTGLVFCADCGAKMMNHRSRGGTENNPYPSDFYDCSTYTLAHQKRTHACSGHYIRSKVLRELILETIRAASTFAISDRDAFLEKVRSAGKNGYGFDAYKEEYCDMIASGIVDPAKVTRSALENAASVSGMVLTTESLVADKPQPPAPAAPAPDMGGMGMY